MVLPHAILIRGLKPIEGLETVLERCQGKIAPGPRFVTKALGLTLAHNHLSLFGPTLWLEDRGIHYSSQEIQVGPRVGIDYAEEHALLPWRFQVKR